jgi:nicotinate-nucleotide pyrophosphorylase (carboxylating)
MTRPLTLPEASIQADVQRALAEDLGAGDVSAALIPSAISAQAQIISREAGVLCGCPWAEAVFAVLDSRVTSRWLVEEGGRLHPGQVFAELTGPARALLSGERTALNFLQTLSGTATLTRRYVEAVAGLAVQILDTRKTLPGLRLAQKYAVRCGGGHNHRMGLHDAILIKENHLVAIGGISAAVAEARRVWPTLPVEVEVETLTQLAEALAAGADLILLDNFSRATITQAVRLAAGRVPLEVSGGVDLAQVADLAATGVARISIGSLTKHVQALDLSMRIRLLKR